MANDFSARSDCLAVYNFESGALATDSKNGTNLTLLNTPTEDTTNKRQGACAIKLLGSSQQVAYVNDAGLPAGWPFAAASEGMPVMPLVVSCWVRPTTVDINQRVIWGKHTGTLGITLRHNNSNVSLLAHAVSITVGTKFTVNQWYHLFFIFNITNNSWEMTIYNLTAGTRVKTTGTIGSFGTGTINASFMVGGNDAMGADKQFDGQIDELVVFNTANFTNFDVSAIRAGLFPVTEEFWHVDFANGLDSQAGVTWASARKTLKTFTPLSPGVVIKMAKCPEVAQAGTCTATLGSNTVQTTNDIAAAIPQYSTIRFGSDPAIYMVLTITSINITLHRPYRGATGSGKTVYKLTLPVVTIGDGTLPTCSGTVSNPILLIAGINTSTGEQDGFTIVNGNNANQFHSGANYNFVNFSRLGYYYFSWVFNSVSAYDCVFEDIYLFRIGLASLYSSPWVRVTVNRIVSEMGRFPYSPLYNCIINDVETAEPGQPGWYGAGAIDTIVNRWKNAGYTGSIRYSMVLNNNNWGLRFIDAVLDELNSGCNQIGLLSTSPPLHCDDVVFHNPIIGSGPLVVNIGGLSWGVTGEVNFINVNGSETDHRTYFGAGKSYSLFILTPDYTNYQTDAPSAKISIPVAATWDGPWYIRHYIPCEAGIAKTISVYLRKNVYYGANTLPFMRLRWMTGTPPNIVHNVHDVAMTDVNDTFQQVSHTITPSIQGVIILEIYIQSLISGAIAWYDKIEVA